MCYTLYHKALRKARLFGGTMDSSVAIWRSSQKDGSMVKFNQINVLELSYIHHFATGTYVPHHDHFAKLVIEPHICLMQSLVLSMITSDPYFLA